MLLLLRNILSILHCITFDSHTVLGKHRNWQVKIITAACWKLWMGCWMFPNNWTTCGDSDLTNEPTVLSQTADQKSRKRVGRPSSFHVWFWDNISLCSHLYHWGMFYSDNPTKTWFFAVCQHVGICIKTRTRTEDLLYKPKAVVVVRLATISSA